MSVCKNGLPTMLAAIAIGMVLWACGGGGGGAGDAGPAPAPGSGSTSTTTTSVTTASSTTTTVAGGTLYRVTFALDNAVTVGSLQLEVDYAEAGGDFVGTGSSVACTSPLSARGALLAFGDDESTATLNVAALALSGFAGPTSLASCDFLAMGPAPTTAELSITVVEANTVDATPIVPLPTVRVSSVTRQ
jgi:hypothetical protein